MPPITLDIWSDFVCPFCYIGKRHLEQALATFPQRDRVKIEWHSFELDPEGKKQPEGTIYELLAKKYGRSLAWAKDASARTASMAAEVGLAFDYDRVIPANTFNAHRLLQLARQNNKCAEAEERFMRAYFTEGKNINDPATLTLLSADVGLDEKEVQRTLDGDTFTEEVRRDEANAQQIGVRGVPFFLFNREIPLSGAQPVETFAAALEQAAGGRPEKE